MERELGDVGDHARAKDEDGGIFTTTGGVKREAENQVEPQYRLQSEPPSLN